MREREAMQASYFGSMGYAERHKFPAIWPVPPSYDDPKIAMQSYQEGMAECEFAEEMGFDWISVSEHHFSGNRTTPNPAVMAAARGLINFMGGPDTVVKQLKAFHDRCDVGVVDLAFQQPGIEHREVMQEIELFGREVLPRIKAF